jgi:hypothetical protein
MNGNDVPEWDRHRHSKPDRCSIIEHGGVKLDRRSINKMWFDYRLRVYSNAIDSPKNGG